ncbi:hypothetical protein CPB85DRAFT_1253986 [Mucidula mucida]|nr:hypothetical protein CPB85DRAFT_1253986 [Mucidula mucida]
MTSPRSIHYERELETSPSLHRLCTSNFPPTEKEASHIRHTILPSIDADISSMGAEIAALQATLQSMEQERDALETVHEQYRNLIHPRRAVPPELWSEIFLLAGHRVDAKSDACDPSGAIWVISHVCRPWRDIALSLHSFWSKVSVDWMPSMAEVLKLVLQRTGQHPLDVAFDDGAEPLDSARRTSYDHSLSLLKDQVFGMLFAESHRWRTFEIFDYHEDSDTLYAPLLGRLPQLESLSLHFSHFVDPDVVAEGQPVILAFSDCPRLTRVVLTGKRRPINLKYASITDLYIEDDAEPLLQEDCWANIRFMGQCTSLEKLRIMGCWYPDHSSSSAPLIQPLMVHSDLHKLTTGCGHLIDRLTLPQLEAVVLFKELDREYANFLPSFDRLLRRSHCTSLTNLSLVDLVLADHLLISVLSQTPSLISLYLHASMADDNDEPNRQAMQEVTEFIQGLQVTPKQNTTFLPRLASVKIRLTGHMDSSFPYFGQRGSFSSMLKARRNEA